MCEGALAQSHVQSQSFAHSVFERFEHCWIREHAPQHSEPPVAAWSSNAAPDERIGVPEEEDTCGGAVTPPPILTYIVICRLRCK